jgi:hypothetical protein
MVSSATGNELIQYFTNQSNQYHSQNAYQWKKSPKFDGARDKTQYGGD